MEKETTGTVIAVNKQFWIKINRKPMRLHMTNGAEFPYIIKVKYTVDGIEYIRRKWIGAGKKLPLENSTVKIFYNDKKPSVSKIEL